MKKRAKLWDGCKVEKMKDFILRDICIIHRDKSLPEIKKCHHIAKGKRNCEMVHAMVTFTNIMQEFLQEGPLQDLKPKFELVGSIAEGTRICIGNELDLGLSFESLTQHNDVPFKVKGDPFSLKKTKAMPKMMERFPN